MPSVDKVVRHRDVVTNGVRLHVAEAGDARGPLVLLLHGFPECWRGFRHQIPYLAGRGFRVWAPDQRGYGTSDKPSPVAAYDIEQLVADAVGLVDAARRRKAIVVGHDWGGVVGWWLALTRPERIDRLVILNVPHPHVLRRHLLTNPAQMMRSWYTLPLQVPLLPERVLGARHSLFARRLLKSAAPRAFPAAELHRYEQAWSQPGAWRGMVNWYRAAARRSRRRLPDPRVKVPTLVVWGARDPWLGRELVRPSLDFCDDGRLELVADAGHFVQHEAAARVNRALGRFVTAGRGR